jgi:VanZ family protein
MEPQFEDSLGQQLNKNRLAGLTAGFAIGYSAGLVGLYKAWYKYDDISSFHFHNDLRYWNQLDKAGHVWASFHQSRLGVSALRWAGVEDRKAIIYGGLLGIVLQTPIEIFDGFSRTYGASVSDALANVAGSAFLVGQELAWGKVRIMPKFSFNRSPYAPRRLEMFGESLPEQILKDYNGQSYWLAFDVSSFLPAESRYPKWLGFSLGYGAGEMIYGNPSQNQAMGYQSYRRFFISPDINLQNIPSRKKLVKAVFYALNAFRMPLPAVELNTKTGIIFHPFYH